MTTASQQWLQREIEPYLSMHNAPPMPSPSLIPNSAVLPPTQATMDAADADDNTTPTTTISNRGFDLVGFTLALDNLTLLAST